MFDRILIVPFVKCKSFEENIVMTVTFDVFFLFSTLYSTLLYIVNTFVKYLFFRNRKDVYVYFLYCVKINISFCYNLC